MKSKILTCSAAIFSLLPLFVQADDTEIFTGIAERDAPNVIFIMDTSGSMSWANNGSRNPPPGQSRLEQVQEAAIDTINNTDGINIALMQFDRTNSANGGFVDLAMTPVAEARADFERIMNNYYGGGGTPLTESLEEAIRYLKGDYIKYGRKYNYYNNYTYYGDANARSGSKYKSPISHQCQKNHIVLFSDGEPSSDTSSNSYIYSAFNALTADEENIIRQSYPPFNPSSSVSYVDKCRTNSSAHGSCAEELALIANMTDLSNVYDGIQNVTIHTVGGFVQGSAQTKLENIAKYGSWAAPGKEVNTDLKEGSGIYANVQDYSSLKKSLKDIFDSIATTSSTFTAPAVSVNAFNNLEHLDQLYYSVFKPADSAGWSGNLKRYRLSSDGDIVDQDGKPAVDRNTGFFLSTSQSYWTPGSIIDGNEVRKGGAASRFTTDNRNVVSYFGNSKDLFSTENRINENNANITNDLLSLPSTYTAAQKEKLIKWAKGIDVNDEDNDTLKDDARIFMEDPLHSQPVVITYGKDTVNKTLDSTIFLATNSGYLHAFSSDENNPQEHFSFIPSELLDNLYQYFTGLSSLDKVYGLDGQVSYWHKDDNNNGVILNSAGAIETGEHIYLYAGMRRGGRSYYALDVSDRDNPKYLWNIDNTVTGFSKLGQTWSKMTPADIIWKGVETKVLFFGGGYDVKEDDKGIRSRSDTGNAIYMVNAATGKLLWTGSNSGANLNLSEMTSSIVSDIATLDKDLDGYIDLLYTADVGGRVWRIDLNNNALSANTFAQGGLVADFNGGTSTTNVRFFNTPDIAYSRYGDLSLDGQYQINIGSGYRAHPLDTRTTDRFYIINDFNVSSAPSTYQNYSESDLASLVNLKNLPTDAEKLERAEKLRAGSYLKLATTGEKVLANSLTVANNVLFTTYRPSDLTSASNCDADTGSSRFYQIKPITSTGNANSTSERDISVTDLPQGGIPPNPVVIFPPRKPAPDPTPDPAPGDNGGGGGGGPGPGDCPEGQDCSDPNPCSSSPVALIAAAAVDIGSMLCSQLSKSYWYINK